MPALWALAAGAAVALAILLTACEKPDASHVTSPSAKALLGVTTGNVSYAPAEAPPSDVPSPDRWDVRFENARFSELENGIPSIQVVMQIQSRPGPGFELWLLDANGGVLRWSGGSARAYDGVVCFQLQLEKEGEALRLGDAPYTMVAAFRDPADGTIVVAQTQRVAGSPPSLDGAEPGPQSEVGRELLGCPRSVI